MSQIQTNEYVKQDEFDALVIDIIEISFKAGGEEKFKQDVEKSKAGWAQAIKKSNEQAEVLTPVIQSFRREGIVTYQAIADELNDLGIKTNRGSRWYPSTARLLVERIKGLGSDKFFKL